MINKERLQLGLDALRSGRYEQAQGSLCKIDDGKRSYCCLGVLTDVALKNGIGRIEEFVAPDGVAYRVPGTGECQWSVLPEPVRMWYGFDSKIPSVVVDDDKGWTEEVTILNDGEGWGFHRIADAIEATFMEEK